MLLKAKTNQKEMGPETRSNLSPIKLEELYTIME